MSDKNFKDEESFEEFWNDAPTEKNGKARKVGRKARKETVRQVDDGSYGDYIPDDGLEERDYRPVRQRRDGKTGFLGGFMYFIFIVSVSIILACLAWMAASDVLALNKEELTTDVVIPEEIFTPGQMEVKNEDGSVTYVDVDIADMGEVASILKNAGIIDYKPLFSFYSTISKAKYKIDPGTYTLSTELDYRAIVKKMQFGSDSQVRTTITFPEGFTVKQIFRRLEENKICKYDELMECAANYEFNAERYPFLADIPYGDASRLEGFLFPDTYEFYQGMTPQAAIDTFLQIFKARITAEMLDWIEASGYSYRDIINIASMIEKETSGSEEDRKNIASVIFNRLRSGINLYVDATSVYSHQDAEGNPAELIHTWVGETDDPYNTRYNSGLPPTPISNPGIASITAALRPNETNYLYYALDTATNEHRFFSSQSEFDNFVATQNY